MPYCFIFSVIEIAKLFLITNTLEIIIIPITIPAKEYNICNVPLSFVTPDHLNNSEFVVYFASVNCFSISLVIL